MSGIETIVSVWKDAMLGDWIVSVDDMESFSKRLVHLGDMVDSYPDEAAAMAAAQKLGAERGLRVVRLLERGGGEAKL